MSTTLSQRAVVFLLGALACTHAWGAAAQSSDAARNSCRTAVIVYLDVSGSISASANDEKIEEAFKQLLEGNSIVADQDELIFFPFADFVEGERRVESTADIDRLFQDIRDETTPRNRTDLNLMLEHMKGQLANLPKSFDRILVVIASDFVHHPPSNRNKANILDWQDSRKTREDAAINYLAAPDQTSVLLLVAPPAQQDADIAEEVLTHLASEPTFVSHDLADSDSARDAVQQMLGDLEISLQFTGAEGSNLQATITSQRCRPLTLEEVRATCRAPGSERLFGPVSMRPAAEENTLTRGTPRTYNLELWERRCRDKGSSYQVAVQSDVLPTTASEPLEYRSRLIVRSETVGSSSQEPMGPMFLPQTLRFDVELQGQAIDPNPWSLTLRPQSDGGKDLQRVFQLPRDLDLHEPMTYRFVIPGLWQDAPEGWVVLLEDATTLRNTGGASSGDEPRLKLSPNRVGVSSGWLILVLWGISGCGLFLVLYLYRKVLNYGYPLRSFSVVLLWLGCAVIIIWMHFSHPDVSDDFGWRGGLQLALVLLPLWGAWFLWKTLHSQKKIQQLISDNPGGQEESLGELHVIPGIYLFVGVVVLLALIVGFGWTTWNRASEPPPGDIQDFIYVERP